MRRTSSMTPLLRAALAVGFVSAAFAACTGEEVVEEAAPAAQPAPVAPTSTRAPLAYTPVPSDFPKMLGCTPAEIAHPNPTVQAKSQKLCDAAHIGLYQLSLDTTISEDQLKQLAGSIMLTTLEKLAVARESSGSDGGMPPP
ncbi:MAG: hypothetical protein JXB05_05585 [Myxococcaceae bacterium]|nr:hypothetical protein [Myxococcaceae bacterium]